MKSRWLRSALFSGSGKPEGRFLAGGAPAGKTLVAPDHPPQGQENAWY